MTTSIENQVTIEEARRLGGKSQLVATLLGQLRQLGLPEPMTEVRFHPTRKWRWDLAWPTHRSTPGHAPLAVEVDGGTWTGGRHVRGAGYEMDAEKINEGVLIGWSVLRVTGGMVEDGRAARLIERALR